MYFNIKYYLKNNHNYIIKQNPRMITCLANKARQVHLSC